ncbi:MAG: hypothetical protein GXO81_08470 [Chlorobi bacterium]|nr:hypothetical protein [Chlorobiota bacterium]
MEATDQVKENITVFDFMLNHILVNKNILDDKEMYKYLYSVESVNKLVKDGMSFRDAYKIVGEQIMGGDYHPEKALRHTHEGSIGNLCNDKIREKFHNCY